MKAVTEALQPLPGVAEVNVDFPNRIAKCKVDDKFDADGAITTLAEAGYKGSSVITN